MSCDSSTKNMDCWSFLSLIKVIVWHYQASVDKFWSQSLILQISNLSEISIYCCVHFVILNVIYIIFMDSFSYFRCIYIYIYRIWYKCTFIIVVGSKVGMIEKVSNMFCIIANESTDEWRKTYLAMTRGQIENFIKRNGKNLFYSLIYDFTTASMTK